MMRWSVEHFCELMVSYETRGAADLAREFGKTATAVRSKAFRERKNGVVSRSRKWKRKLVPGKLVAKMQHAAQD